MSFQVLSIPPEQVEADALVVLHEEGGLLAEAGNEELRKHLEAYARDVDARRTRREWFCTLPPSSGCRTRHLLLDSVRFSGPAPHDEPLKIAAARCVSTCRQYSLSRIAFLVHHHLAAEKAGAIIEGALLGDFQDRRFKGATSPDEPEEEPLELIFVTGGEHAGPMEQHLRQREIVAEAQNYARELINAPHHVLTPAVLATEAERLATRHGMEFDVLEGQALRDAGHEPTWNVGRGSEYPPRLFVMRYKPANPAVPLHLGLAGKGITYDSGGLSIKTAETMHRMNADMGGAAAVLGAMEAIARLELPVRTTAIIAAAHNAVDGAAYHPGSILRAKNGKTIYVENTDAEGRLILTDCFARAGEEGTDLLWDFATLTGAVAQALGPAMGGVFTDDDELRTVLLEAAGNTGDGLWPLPLFPEYQPLLRHHLADLSNRASEKTAAGIHAANFLKEFVPADVRWAHLDIAGAASLQKPRRYYRTGGTGFGVRLIVEAIRLLAGRMG